MSRSRRHQPATLLVTAGPTIEDIDPVRFISNRSSGRLGVEIARAALAERLRVILVHGPVPESVQRMIPRSPKLTVVPVRSAADMQRAVMSHVARAGAVVMNAAVADYTPERTAVLKLKKSRRALVLKLKPTVDILRALGRLKAVRPERLLVGFALETGRGATPAQRARTRLAEARRKLSAKNLDAIVLDTPAAMGAETSDFVVLQCGAAPQEFRAVTKARFARRLVALIKRLNARRCSPAQRPARRPAGSGGG
jgi:phosphopantothenoylcysteine decarboxylase/phosphopantothenate--cysteine ligase